MAKLIPELDPYSISNFGERAFYNAASELPDDYTVLYSYKYKLENDEKIEQICEADFVINPSLGYLVVEVKQGDVAFINGCWHEFKKSQYTPLNKDPVEQAQRAMFAILDRYKEKANSNFPLKIRYAVCFPECSKISGQLPSDLDEKSIILESNLENLHDKILEVFDVADKKQERVATDLLIKKVLAPSFKVFARLEDKIEQFNQQTKRVLTEEQERILEETELDKRKIFFGAAGTGKTFIAMEKAKRLASSGQRVLLTCFNKNLAKYLQDNMPTEITIANFHNFIEDTLREKGFTVNPPEELENLDKYYKETLPDLAFDYFSDAQEGEKYDAVIVDEGQDFREEWIICLETMLKDNGEFYIFADPHQNIFKSNVDKLKEMAVSKHRLTRNMRNTEIINDWFNKYIPKENTISVRSFHKGGMPVAYFNWQKPQEEKRQIIKEVGRLVSQGMRVERILILSPHRKENSSLASVDKLREWPLVEWNSKQPGIRFATIRSFKGLEADIVFLIGKKKGSYACTDADIYVGASRARFLLYVFQEIK